MIRLDAVEAQKDSNREPLSMIYKKAKTSDGPNAL